MTRSRTKTLAQIDDLVLDSENANRGTRRGKELLAESLRLHGAGRSIVADRKGRVIAGNKTLEEARALGLPIQVVRTDGGVLVVVQREDLDLSVDKSARALAVRDNRVAELDLNWNPEVLFGLKDIGIDFGALWSADEWAAVTAAVSNLDDREDKVLEPGPTKFKRGDLIALGPHRLLCGDATDPEDVHRLLDRRVPTLMATDPPYGVGYDPKWRQRAFPRQRTAIGAVMNDDRASWREAFELFPGDVVYAWHAGARSGETMTALNGAGFEVRSQIVWVKSHFALGRGCYHQGHEPAFFAVRKGAATHWQGDRKQTTVWTIPNLNPFGGSQSREDRRTSHSTQKPVRLFEIPILNHLGPAEAIYDPFCGSGSMLIAAEKTGRIGYAMDLDARYVQVAVDRWQAYAGQTARLLKKG